MLYNCQIIVYAACNLVKATSVLTLFRDSLWRHQFNLLFLKNTYYATILNLLQYSSVDKYILTVNF
jgi:hypothetical protein